MSESCRYVVVGNGYRAQSFLKLAAQLSEVELAGIVVRRPEIAKELPGVWQVPAFVSLPEAIAAVRPDFVVVSVSREASPAYIEQAVERGTPVMTETPPAGDAEALRALWGRVGASGLVQVAEQYSRYPGHAARLALVRSGRIGEATSVQVSSTHGYHAISLMRQFLGVGFAPATVKASAFPSPLVNPLTRSGWTDDESTHEVETVIATVDFGGPMGLYDFTTLQWRNFLRSRRVVIRGSNGEIVDESVVRLGDRRTFITSPIVRRQMGYDMDFNGFDTVHLSYEGEVLFRNPFVGLRLSDDEIAVCSLLVDMARWIRSEGPPPYPLAAGCQDQLISLAIDEAVASGTSVTTGNEPWATTAALGT